jgi:ATP phosphoribosyltransferase regulatory subunit
MLRTPLGTRDYALEEAEAYSRLERALERTFELWGYREVRTPCLESLEVFSGTIGPGAVDRAFKFQDYDGRLLALRAEGTAPTARLFASTLINAPRPCRLFYIAKAFRFATDFPGDFREFSQAGAELIGSGEPSSDAEVMALSIAALEDLGLGGRGLRIDLGHANLMRELISRLLGGPDGERALDLLRRRDLRGALSLFKGRGLPPEAYDSIAGLLRCRRADEFLAMDIPIADAGIREMLKGFAGVIEEAEEYGIGDKLFLDFSLIRDLEYYTGAIFEISMEGLGVPVGGGGRYDALIEKFCGLRIPAVGFALNLNRLMEGMGAGSLREDRRKRVIIRSKNRREAIEIARELRGKGIIAVVSLERDDSLSKGGELEGFDYLIVPSGDGSLRIADLRSGAVKASSLEGLLAELGGGGFE